jgi:hypothetical protein
MTECYYAHNKVIYTSRSTTDIGAETMAAAGNVTLTAQVRPNTCLWTLTSYSLVAQYVMVKLHIVGTYDLYLMSDSTNNIIKN